MGSAISSAVHQPLTVLTAVPLAKAVSITSKYITLYRGSWLIGEDEAACLLDGPTAKVLMASTCFCPRGAGEPQIDALALLSAMLLVADAEVEHGAGVESRAGALFDLFDAALCGNGDLTGELNHVALTILLATFSRSLHATFLSLSTAAFVLSPAELDGLACHVMGRAGRGMRPNITKAKFVEWCESLCAAAAATDGITAPVWTSGDPGLGLAKRLGNLVAIGSRRKESIRLDDDASMASESVASAHTQLFPGGVTTVVPDLDSEPQADDDAAIYERLFPKTAATPPVTDPVPPIQTLDDISIISTELFGGGATDGPGESSWARQIHEEDAPPYEADLVSVVSAELFPEPAAPSGAAASVEAPIIDDDDGLSVVSTSLFPEADPAVIVAAARRSRADARQVVLPQAEAENLPKDTATATAFYARVGEDISVELDPLCYISNASGAQLFVGTLPSQPEDVSLALRALGVGGVIVVGDSSAVRLVVPREVRAISLGAADDKALAASVEFIRDVTECAGNRNSVVVCGDAGGAVTVSIMLLAKYGAPEQQSAAQRALELVSGAGTGGQQLETVRTAAADAMPSCSSALRLLGAGV